jgi:glycogen phosphorylase
MDKFQELYKEEFKLRFASRLERTYSRAIDHTSDVEKYIVLGDMLREEAMLDWKIVKAKLRKGSKQVYYFSMEFLLGRMLVNNLINLKIYEPVKDGLAELGIELGNLIEVEDDQGLGNGGLGRLAACFMDSIASLGYAGHGNTIRYNFGFFNQRFENGYQVEYPQPWLSASKNVWEVRKPNDRVEVKFYGKVELDSQLRPTLTNYVPVDAVAYDMPLIGYQNGVTNKLRMWSAEPNMNVPYPHFQHYENQVREISDVLYPDDSTRDGKILRLKQQYFFSAAGLAYIIKNVFKEAKTLDTLADRVVIQINDTHPAILVAELMRVLMDEYSYTWDKAWPIVTKTLAYTNHTILAEALEKWDVDIMKELLPRIFMIIEEIDARFVEQLKRQQQSNDMIESLRIIRNNRIHMAHLAIIGCFSVNGVAALHTEILKSTALKHFYALYPEKFNNKTNGVTHRRWLLNCNPLLSNEITRQIGESWIAETTHLKRLERSSILTELREIKRGNKERFADYIKARQGLVLNLDSIFDVQIKRLHAYKRQLMNALHIIYLYDKLKQDKAFYDQFYPQTFIFGAKAAPSYVFAKQVIKLINSIANKVNNDPQVNQKLMVVFIENYNVSSAEIVIPAADVSEQISLAGKEASGTGNMKFQMNGALTIGTMDGANVEIFELVGDENIFIFGMTTDQVVVKRHDYQPRILIDKNPLLQSILARLTPAFFEDAKPGDFDAILEEMYNRDEYMVIEDFESYRVAQEKLNQAFKDHTKWDQMCLVNIARSGFFSTDRTIQQYVDDIWKLDKVS